MLDTVIIGGGLAGLACARQLQARGLTFAVLEASDAVGGRVRTDSEAGFLLDRGFQVLLTAYPEAQSQLDYGQLELCNFAPGAMVYAGGRFHCVADPLRDPAHAFETAFSNLLTWRDKFAVARLWLSVRGKSPAELFTGEQESTLHFLRTCGITQQGIDQFFRPFFGGVFLDTSLSASGRYFKFLFQCFAKGQTSVPRLGIQRIPQTLADRLPPARVFVNTPATKIERLAAGRYLIQTAAGTPVEARHVVVATDADAARRLLPPSRKEFVRAKDVIWNGTTTFYYAADHAPMQEPMLMLNGEGAEAGPVNHAAVISNVSPAYAPAGAHLVCANVVGHATSGEQERMHLESECRAQLRRWFGQPVDAWEVVGGYFIPHAVPSQRSAEWERGPVSVKTRGSRGKRDDVQEIFVCGDYCETASIQGALASGRRTAEAVAAALLRD